MDEENTAKIYPVGAFESVDWNTEESCLLGAEYATFALAHTRKFQNFITVATDTAGDAVLRLVETKRYILKMDMPKDAKKLPHFQNEGNHYLKLDRDETSVTFQFVNYLGRSKVLFETEHGIQSLSFEVVPDKMDYEDDYIRMTESLAETCSELLLEYSGATSNRFRQESRDSKTLLEQFIFLRQFCYSQNLQSLFAAIRRNPDRILVSEEIYKPIGQGIPSKKFFANPFSYGRNWQRICTGENGRMAYLPQEVAVTQKHDSLDTPANRFIKYALERFDAICQGLILALTNPNGSVKQAECLHEARLLHQMLEEIFRDSFFKEVGPLDMMPQNNQVLQKREGYSQIFAAYSMIDLALQLDWKGKDDIYEGESKNVALLYEYWLFFELYKMIQGIDGCEVISDPEAAVTTNTDGGLTISLKQDKQSRQSFAIRKYGVKINLYYNRTFSPNEFATTRYEGSYSRPFRPDYTIAVYPENYAGKLNGEKQAIRDGEVSYIHFDAKYRITDLTAFVGRDENGKRVDEEKELSEDKQDAITNTYKRGDLLKMHTYNDAIRRTIGSYVLYPGSGNLNEDATFRVYDEILPGVGAFAIRPGNVGESETALRDFITQLIAVKQKNASRLNRLQYYAEAVLREPSLRDLDARKRKNKAALPVSEMEAAFDERSTDTDNHDQESVYDKAREHSSAETAVMKNLDGVSGGESVYRDDWRLANANQDKACMIGYIRNDRPSDYYASLQQNGLLRNGQRFWFYFYAIKGQQVYSHHKDIARTRYFRFYTNNIHATGSYELEPVLCEVKNYELISKGELVQRLLEQGYQTTEENHHADFYYVLTVKVADDACEALALPLAMVNAQNGNDTFSPHSPKIVNIEND